MNWDEYYLNVCNVVAENSKCLSRKIGAILVKDKSIISTGYNGPPRGVPHCGKERYKKDLMLQRNINNHEDIENTCPRQIMGYKSSEGLEVCISGHAERNALINAARHGIKTKEASMYMNCPTPCTPCLIEIINAGIVEIVFTKLHYYDLMSEFLIEHSSLVARTYKI